MPHLQTSSDTAAPSRDRYVRYAVLAWLCLAATIAYVHRNCLGVAESQIRMELGLSKQQMGWVMSSFFLTYAIFQLPSGAFVDRCGTRRALPLFSLFWSAATALLAVPLGIWTMGKVFSWEWRGDVVVITGSLLWLLTARLAMGAAQAGIFPASTRTIAQWLPGSRRGLAAGLLAAFMSVGAAAGAQLTGYLLERIDWRLMVALYSIPGFVFAAWFWSWFRDRPEDHEGVGPAELRAICGKVDTSPTRELAAEQVRANFESDPNPYASPQIAAGSETGSAPSLQVGLVSSGTEDSHLRVGFTSMLLSWPLWCICGQQFFRAMGYIFYTSWFTTFLRETRNIGTAEAGLLTSLPLWAVVAGSPLGGLCSDWLLKRTGSRYIGRQLLSGVSMAACAALILVSQQVSQLWPAVLIISAGSFCAAFGGPSSYAITIDMGGRQVATIFSIMNMAGNIGAFLFPIIVPWLQEQTGSWTIVLNLFAGIYVAAAVCWLSFSSRGIIGRQ